MPFNAIIFDFNGLIIDDEGIHCDLFQRVLLDEEIQLTDKDYWEKYLGYDDKGLIGAVYERDGVKLTPKKLKDLVQKKNQLYFPELKKRLKLFDGVVAFINEVKNTHALALVSGALRSEIDYVLQEAGLTEAFPVIVSADETRHGKPDPEGFVLALAHLKKSNLEIRPETCLVLEDSVAGIEAAHRTQMKVAALTHTYAKDALGDADYVVDRFEEIHQILKSS